MSYITTGGAIVQEPNGFATSISNQNISDTTWTTIVLNTLETTSYDVTLSSNALVINTAGLYMVNASGNLDQSGSGGVREIRIRVDTGSGFVVADLGNERESDAGTFQNIRIPAGPKWFDVGDEIDVQVYQDSGGDLTLNADDNNTNLKVVRVSI